MIPEAENLSPNQPRVIADGASGSGIRRPILRGLVAMAAFVIISAGLRAAAVIVIPLLLAVFFTIVLSPLHLALTRRRVPDWLSLVLVACLLITTAWMLGIAAKRAATTLLQESEAYSEKFEERKQEAVAWIVALGFPVPDGALDDFDPVTTFDWLQSGWSTIRGVVTNVFLTFFLLLFLLLEVSGFPEKLAAVAEDRVGAFRRVREIVGNVRRYLLIKALISLLTGFLILVVLLLLQVRFALAWASLAFLLNFVPNVGSLIAAAPAMLFVLLEDGPGTMALVGLGYLASNTICGNLIEPRVMGQDMGISPFVVLASLLYWGYVLGPVGMLLAVPLTMAAKVTLDSYDETRWIAVLLGPEHPGPDAVGIVVTETDIAS